MDGAFRELLVQAEKIRATSDKVVYLRFIKLVEDYGTECGLLMEDAEEKIAYRRETAAFILEAYHGEGIGPVLGFSSDETRELIKRGEEAAGVPKYRAIKEHGASPEVIPLLEALDSNVRVALLAIVAEAPGSHTEWVVDKLKRCHCGLITAEFHGYVGGYGTSIDDDWFTVMLDRNGIKVDEHVCNPRGGAHAARGKSQ